ncbi:MAG: hypothetical protein CFE28_02620 [Alphaproteobacteria bacterium PA2]|nr:MAG: hypothetical protein CFE28_02620 [Alphaproteobacteria bacterium PA2]
MPHSGMNCDGTVLCRDATLTDCEFYEVAVGAMTIANPTASEFAIAELGEHHALRSQMISYVAGDGVKWQAWRYFVHARTPLIPRCRGSRTPTRPEGRRSLEVPAAKQSD